MRRKNYKLRDFQLNGAKINCANFSKKILDDEHANESKHQYFVTGDTHNNVRFYQFAAEEELLTFTTSASGNVQPEVSAVSVSWDETNIFSGSNRGIINVWDILSAKNTPACTLKGHATSVNCFGLFPDQDTRIASGSYDTHIKLWDVRTKNNIGMLKHHTKQINSIDVSPDCNYLISGSEDCSTKLWDMRYPEKVVCTYSEHSAPILKVKFNPEDCMFLSSSMDRTAKYFRCEHNHYDYISSTELVSMPVTAADFNHEGKLVCTAGNQYLKIWNMEKQGILLESIQSSWKGVHDVLWVQKGIKGLASHGGALSVWFCYLGDQKQEQEKYAQENESKLPKIYKNPSMRKNQSRAQDRKAIKNAQKNPVKEQQHEQRNKELQQVMNNINFAIGVVNNLDKEKQSKEKEEQRQQQKERKQKERQERIEKEKAKDEERKEKLRMQKQKEKEEKERKQRERKERIQRELQDEERMKKERLEAMEKDRQERQKILQQKLHETFEKNNNSKNNLELTLENDLLEDSVMGISAFMGEGIQKEKKVQLQLISEFMKEQSRFESVFKTRSSHVKPIIHYWNIGKIDSALYTLAQADTGVAYDCISAILHNSKFKSAITPDVACALLKKLVQIMHNKHSTYVKNSMYFLNDIVLMFKDQLIKVKMFNPLTRVDLSREERIAKYDRLTEQFLNVFKQERLKKYASLKTTENQELHQIAGQLYRNLEQVLQKLIPRNDPEPA